MRTSKLTFICAVFGPLLFASGACFLSTEEDPYSETSSFETGGGAGSCGVGQPGCACTQSGVCDKGLECVDMLNICVVPTGCDVGSAGCECTAGDACDPGLLCKEGICVSEMPCLPENTGTMSCQCTQGGGCDPGLDCLSGLCVDVPDPVTTGESDSDVGESTGTPATTTGTPETGGASSGGVGGSTGG